MNISMETNNAVAEVMEHLRDDTSFADIALLMSRGQAGIMKLMNIYEEHKPDTHKGTPEFIEAITDMMFEMGEILQLLRPFADIIEQEEITMNNIKTLAS